MLMNFVCYTHWEQLPPSSRALFGQGEEDSIFFSRAWLEHLSTALDDDYSLLLACVVAGHQVLAILPLMKSEGDILYSLKHRYTTHFGLLLADENRQQIIHCLSRGLSQQPCTALLLEPVADDDGSIIELQQALETIGYRCVRSFRFYNWVHRPQGQSYEDYLADRPARLRNTIARKKRKLGREHGYHMHLFEGDEVPRQMSDYYAAYSASWKANEQYVGFLNGIVADFSSLGWTRLAVLYGAGRPIAAQLWFVAGGTASIFRLAYDEAWKQYSPGSILTDFLMQHVIDIEKVDEVDFLAGNEAYKQDWMSDRRERFALSCVKPRKPASRRRRFVESLRRFFSAA